MVNIISFGIGYFIQRPLWTQYYKNRDVIIFMLDSNDHVRISECKDELWRYLCDDKLRNAIILVLANKQDLPNTMCVKEVAEKLEIEKVKNRKIRKCSRYKVILMTK